MPAGLLNKQGIEAGGPLQKLYTLLALGWYFKQTNKRISYQ